MKSGLPAHIAALLDPHAYPDAPASVDLVQTHISYVFLAGEFVYKLKKPVDFGFLDYTTLEKRRTACEDELRLNRRLSPDVYIDVLPVTQTDGQTWLGGSGGEIDWAVRMRRLPAEKMLEALIEDNAVPASAGTRLGEIIGRFHQTAERSERITEIGGRTAVASNWVENFDQTRPFRGQTISTEDDDRIHWFVRDFLEREAELLEQRDRDGHIRDLHGDLRAAQIWVLDQAPPEPETLSAEQRTLLESMGGVRILDCIEFNERLRFCDCASDLAFLMADLDYRRRADLSADLAGRYLEVTGDERLPLLLSFYSCYRAFVRGKVDSLALTQREIDGRQRQRLAARARGFFRLAARYASEPPPSQLVLMMGISGSGKSYIGRRLALRLGAAIFSSDATRKRLLGLLPTQRATDDGYSAELTDRTYADLVHRAEAELRRGHAVVLDATFLTQRSRASAIDLALRLGVPLSLVWCQAPPDVLQQRLRDRSSDRFLVSDADAAIAELQKAQQEPPDEVPVKSVLRMDTAGEIEPQLNRILRRLGARKAEG